jgi:hypothetical protein
MKRKKRTDGLTYAEIICAMTIFLIITGLCTSLFFSSWRRYNTLNAINDVQRNALLGMSRFSRDFSETAMSSIVNGTKSSRKYVYFPSKRDKNGIFDYSEATYGGLLWKTWIIYYLYPDPGKKTVDNRQLYILARKIKDSPLQPSSLEIVSLTSNLKNAQVMTRGVYSFTIEQKHLGEVDTFRAVLQTQGQYGGKKCSFSVEKIFLLNSM